MHSRLAMLVVAGMTVALASSVAVPRAAATGGGVTSRASVAWNGRQGNADSSDSWTPPAISAGGRFVAFSSKASNLVPGDTNGASDVFLRDRLAGVTRRVSVGAVGQANGDSAEPSISADGRFVAFSSQASNLVPGDTNGTSDIFVRDMLTGVTRRVSVGAAGQANGGSLSPAISADGRFVAFNSYASNLVPGDTNGTTDIFVRDLLARVTRRVSVGPAGQGNSDSSGVPAISADGRFVTFTSSASNLVPGDTNGAIDVFVRDLQAGVTKRVSVGTGGQANDYSFFATISADGRFVAFESFAANLVPGDTNGTSDIFVRDLQAGVTRRVSVGAAGQGNSDSSGAPAISADGRYVAFFSHASNLVPGDTNGAYDIFVRDLLAGVTRRVSVGASGQGNRDSLAPAITADGRSVAFVSASFNLVTHDTNRAWDVFVRDPLLDATIGDRGSKQLSYD